MIVRVKGESSSKQETETALLFIKWSGKHTFGIQELEKVWVATSSIIVQNI